MIIARYFDYFMLFSFIGWVYECTFCTITNKKWSNRGFLYGPICPIYGSGATLAMLIFSYVPSLSYESPWWKIFLICMIGSAILEYTTSYVLEKKFHALWWDYSNLPFNLNGRISLPTAMAFGVAGIIVVKYILPVIEQIPIQNYPLATEAIAMLLMAMGGADLALTVASLTELIARMDSMEEAFNQKIEAGVEIAQGGPVAIGSHIKNAALNSEPVEMARELKNGISMSIRQTTEGFSNSVKERTDAFTVSVKDYASRMNRHEKYHLNSIRRFKRNDKSSVSLKLKQAVAQLQGKRDTSKSETEADN